MLADYIKSPMDCLRFETYLYGLAERTCAEYTSGTWEVVSIRGGFYMRVEQEQTFTVSIPGNGFEGRVGSDAVGIALSLFVINHLGLDDYFRPLYRYALRQNEVDNILRMID